MITTTRTIRMVPYTSIIIPSIFIVKVNKKFSNMHSPDPLTNSLIAIENEWLGWRKKNFSVGVAIAPAAILRFCIAII